MSTGRFAALHSMQAAGRDDPGRPTLIPSFDPASLDAPEEDMPTAIPPAFAEEPHSRSHASDALELIDAIDLPPIVTSDERALSPIDEMRAHVDARDYQMAITLAESILADDPSNSEARLAITQCNMALRDELVARVGSLDAVPVLSVSLSALRDLPLDHRAGFMLSRMDGISSLEMILDMCGMSEIEALQMVCDLVARGIIEFA